MYTIFTSYFCKIDFNNILLSSPAFSKQFLTLGLMREQNNETGVKMSEVGLQQIACYRKT